MFSYIMGYGTIILNYGLLVIIAIGFIVLLYDGIKNMNKNGE